MVSLGVDVLRAGFVAFRRFAEVREEGEHPGGAVRKPPELPGVCHREDVQGRSAGQEGRGFFLFGRGRPGSDGFFFLEQSQPQRCPPEMEVFGEVWRED